MVAAIATVLKLYYLPYRDKKTKKRIRDKRELEKRIDLLTFIKNQLNESLDTRVRPNKFDLNANVGWYVAEFEKRVKEYHERFNECGDWYYACTKIVELEHIALVKKHFRNMQEISELYTKLLANPLVEMYIEGEKVTLTFIKDSYPNLHKDLMEIVKDEKVEKKEQTLSAFFIETNRLFSNHKILVRFRKEKKRLEEFGRGIQADMEKSLSSLKQESSNYNDLKFDAEPLSDSTQPP